MFQEKWKPFISKQIMWIKNSLILWDDRMWCSFWRLFATWIDILGAGPLSVLILASESLFLENCPDLIQTFISFTVFFSSRFSCLTPSISLRKSAISNLSLKFSVLKSELSSSILLFSLKLSDLIYRLDQLTIFAFNFNYFRFEIRILHLQIWVELLNLFKTLQNFVFNILSQGEWNQGKYNYAKKTCR